MKKPFLSLLIVAPWALTVYAQTGNRPTQGLSMSRALSLARELNPKIIEYKERLESKAWDNRAATGNFLPSVSVNAGYTALNAPLTIDLDPIRRAMISLQTSTLTKMALDSFVRAGGGAVTPAMASSFSRGYSQGVSASLDAALPHFIDTLKDQTYPSANITVAQPLFMGGKLMAAKKAADADRKAALCELSRVRNEVEQETFDDYCSVALLSSVISVRKDVLRGMLNHEKDASRLCESGMIARTNLLRARVAVAEAQRALYEDVNRLSLAKIALARSIGLADSCTMDLLDSLSSHPLPGSVDDYLAQADAHQPILEYIQTRSQAAEAKVAAERAQFLPRIAAFGRVELFPDYLSALEPQWSAGVTMSMDIFSGGKNFARLASARHTVQETNALLASTRRDIHLWVRKAYIECETATYSYNKLMSDEALAGENLRQCKSRFENGFGTSLEIIDAELSLEKNRLDKITALYNFHRAFMDLCAAIGEPEKALTLMNHSTEVRQ